MGYEQQYEYLKNLCLKLKPVRVTMDATGMGAPVAERFEGDKYLAGFKLHKITFSSKSKHEMARHFTKLLEDKLILLPNDNRLLDQMLNQRFRDSGGMRIYACPTGEHDDILWSLILCVFDQRGEVLTYSVLRKRF